MASVSIYLNFPGHTEEAFNFYKSVFGGEFHEPVSRFGSMPPAEGQPPLPKGWETKIMHISMPILGGAHTLMGSDVPDGFGPGLKAGNNVQINLTPDSREETERLFVGLSAGGQVSMPLQDMFWGAYFGSVTDKYGIHWMVNFDQN